MTIPMTSIRTLWATLDPTVQQWLLQNPGTLMLPRTQVNMVEVGAGQVLRLDQHGEYWLSSADMVFLRSKRGENPGATASRFWQRTRTKTPPEPPDRDPHHDALDQ